MEVFFKVTGHNLGVKAIYAETKEGARSKRNLILEELSQDGRSGCNKCGFI
jgi:hypothetical protein